jgi:CTP synthase
MADQLDVVSGERDMGGTMRLGAYPCSLTPGTVARRVYGQADISERHRHRYEVNNDYRDRLSASGLVISGTSPDGRLVELVELPPEVNPFYVGTQAHPEFRSRPTRAHPLFRSLALAAVAHAERRTGVLPVDLGLSNGNGNGNGNGGSAGITDGPGGVGDALVAS